MNSGGVGAARERLAVLAVGRQHVVVRADGLVGANGHGLLADVEVAEAGDLAEAVRLAGALLETPDEVHLPVHREELLTREVESHMGAAS